MIELINIYKTYQSKYHPLIALKNINLTINSGEIFGLLGASGAGKSTLLRTVNLLERPDQGQVYVDGADLTLLNNRELKLARRHIGMIFQHFNLLASRNVAENIALPLELIGCAKSDIEWEVDKLLTLIHLKEHKHHYPRQLSGGQKQRVAIARALATKPNILLCDEITSALDPQSTLTILNLLREINQTLGVTVFLITHELDVIKHVCDRAGVMHQGELVEVGDTLQLFARAKTDVTKQLIQKALHLELPKNIKDKLQHTKSERRACLVRFTFVGDDSGQPLMTTLVQQFNVTVNIIQANIEHIQSSTVGFTVCQLAGSDENINAALKYVENTNILVEVLGYV